MTNKPKKLSLSEARTIKQVCSLKRDNFSSRGFWIIADGLNVSLVEQEKGGSPTVGITIPQGVFNELVRKYQKPQDLT